MNLGARAPSTTREMYACVTCLQEAAVSLPSLRILAVPDGLLEQLASSEKTLIVGLLMQLVNA